MNLTVSSSGDPHRDSCATLGKGNPPRRDSASPKIGMFDTNFTALFSCWFVFHRYCGQTLTSSNENKLSHRERECARGNKQSVKVRHKARHQGDSRLVTVLR